MKNTLIKSILFAGTVLVSQASFALYFDAGIGSSKVEDDSDTYLRLGVGDKFQKNLGWEAGYWDVGSNADVHGFYGDVKVSTKLNSDTELFGKAGLYMWDADGGDGNDLFLGGGVTFLKIGPGNINLEILIGDLDSADLTTIGGSYSIPLNM